MSRRNNEETKQFLLEQVKITKKIIDECSIETKIGRTTIINSLLSLIVLPFEEVKKKNMSKIFPGRMAEINSKLGFTPTVFQPIKRCDGESISYAKRTIYTYVNKLRNGVAHQNISIAKVYDKQTLIIISNYYSCSKCKGCKKKKCQEKGLTRSYGKVTDFEISVTISQLLRLARYISGCYIEAIE